jgi:hypothetical protein
MIGTLIRKELLANLLTGRLVMAFSATVVLAVGVTLVASLDYSTRRQTYRSARQQTEEALRQATIYAQVAPDVHLPPQPLSSFCLGAEAWVGNSIAIRGNARVLLDNSNKKGYFIDVQHVALCNTSAELSA